MSTKIKGSTDFPISADKPNFTSDENGGIPATLIIHESGEHEEVLLKSEMVAMLEEIINAREAVRNSPEGMVWATPRQDIENIAAKHGITL